MELTSQLDFSTQEWSLGVDLVIYFSDYKFNLATMGLIQINQISTIQSNKLCGENLSL